LRAERRARAANDALVGGVIVGLHALLLVGLLARSERPSLALRVPAGAVVLSAPDGQLPEDTPRPARAQLLVDGRVAAPGVVPPLGAGVHRVDWVARYRGGFEERVGRSVLAGPFQDPAHPPCGVRLVVGQRLLDALLPVLVARLEGVLAGQLGFRRVEGARLVLGDGIELALTLRFSQGRVPLAVRVRPRLVSDRLTLAAEVDAHLELESTWLAGAIDLFGQTERVNRLVRDEAAGQVDQVLGPVAAFLARPPPVPVGQGRMLLLAYCEAEPIAIVPGRSLSVPLAVPILPAASGMLPVALPAEAPPEAPDAPLAIDVSLDAANAILDQMWENGALDLALAQAGLERRFDDAPDVRELLTLRAGPPHLAMPPTLTPSGDPARPVALALEAELVLEDGPLRTPARLFGRVALDLRTKEGAPGAGVVADVDVSDLALTCVPTPGVLSPCYATIFAALRGRSRELHPPIAAALSAWFEDLTAGRSLGGDLGAPGFVLDAATLTPRIGAHSGWIRVQLAGHVVE
jgi:hypothetical protein